MFQLATGALLIAHGLIHLSYATPKVDDERFPFVPERTWFVSATHLEVAAARGVFVALAALTVLAYAVAGIGLVAGAAWWGPWALAGSVASLMTLVLGFHPWLILGVAIDVAIIAGVLAGWPVALFD
jgi:hypothetical protein